MMSGSLSRTIFRRTGLLLIFVGGILFLPNLLSLARLAWIAAEHTAWGFHPGRLVETYVANGNIGRLGIGLAAMFATLAAIIGVPHLMVNTFELARDLRRKRSGKRIDRFIRRQSRMQDEYLDQLSLAEAESLQVDRVFSEADAAEVRHLISQIANRDGSRIVAFWRRFASNKWLANPHAPPTDEITTFSRALFHFFFSFASFTRSAYAYTWLWNAWFAFRTFFPFFHPLLALTVALYPEFFRVATSRVGTETPPSRANGGLRFFWQTFGLSLFYPEIYRRLRRIESRIVEAETRFRNESDAKFSHGSGSHGTRRREALYAASIERWIRKCATRLPEPRTFFLNPIDQVKLAIDLDSESLRLSDDQAKSTVSAAARELETGDPSSRARRSHEWGARVRRSAAALVSPLRSRQIRIIQTTRVQMQNPKAMARAVRSMLASNLVDKPLELFFILVCYAGIEEGLLRPLQSEIFGANSWFYLSRYVFINGYLYGVLAGVFSDTWLKLQQDTMNGGDFSDAPTDDDARRSFAGWLFRMTFRNPKNSWWTSQKFTVMEYILPTLKATFVTALLVNFVTLGRFDLDAFLANFLVLIFLPFTGLSWKIEQGFELASAWVVRDVPLRLRPHALVQSYAQRAIARRRILFNVYYKIWENVTWNYLTTFMNVNTTVYGTRSFSRILFAGFTPTEIIANPLRDIAAWPQLPAPLVWLALQIDSLFTNAYTDGTLLRPRQ